ncbi:hypothetical protein BJ508DRAFT_312375 [Ascobolus immersus RN42]|uniref:Uncharacterized protein n=1 Tax=Ascobolus immersus RN42 TaxID=1160509 RepID=A0A3N4HMG0_ASCIM|nr:hypothetical protein BJ508DRAFT_312375 [Ascobolus immersus RN42]
MTRDPTTQQRGRKHRDDKGKKSRTSSITHSAQSWLEFFEFSTEFARGEGSSTGQIDPTYPRVIEKTGITQNSRNNTHEQNQEAYDTVERADSQNRHSSRTPLSFAGGEGTRDKTVCPSFYGDEKFIAASSSGTTQTTKAAEILTRRGFHKLPTVILRVNPI